MTWKFTSDRPVYLQIMDQLRGAVLSGDYVPGGKIPSVRELATAARVNPNTMQHALQELEHEGLLSAHGTNGRFVTEDPGILEQARQRRLKELTRECAAKFAALGIGPGEAAALLKALEEKEVL